MPSLFTLVLLGLIIVWLGNLKELLYLTTYISTIWLGMSILLLVIIKLFKFPMISNLFISLGNHTPTNIVEPNEQKSQSSENPTNNPDGSWKDAINEIIQTIYTLSQRTHTFSIPLLIPVIFYCVCLIVTIIPVVYDINRLLCTIIFVSTGIPIYFVFLWPDELPDSVKSINAKVMTVAQKIFVALPDELN